MKDLSIGQKVVTYCCGELVEGIVDRAESGGFIVKHRPVNWGNEVYTETFVRRSGSSKHYTPKTYIRI